MKLFESLVLILGLLTITTQAYKSYTEDKVTSKDVGTLVQSENMRLLGAPTLNPGDFTYDTYHPLSVMHDHMNHLANQFPDKVKVFDIGESYEKRKIKVIHISNNISAHDTAAKPILWLDGGIHAREWISPATVMFIVDALVQLHETNHYVRIKAMLDKYQFMIAPQINPDGYEYSRSHERLWRTTRKPAGCKEKLENLWGGCFLKLCYGTDPNRNWDSDWGNSAVDNDPCSLDYPGAAPFDQDNTLAVKSFLERAEIKSKLKLYVTYHSYSQLFLTPLGYTFTPPPDHTHHKTVGDAVVKAIKARHGTIYTNMISAELYPASGQSADWVYEALNLTDSYTVELRDTGNYGFELPTNQILETGEENVDGLLALVDHI